MSLARYTGQSRKLRELAVEKLGAEKVACMSDEECRHCGAEFEEDDDGQ